MALEGPCRWVSAAAAASTSTARRPLANDGAKWKGGFEPFFEPSIIVLNRRYVQLRDNLKGKTRWHGGTSVICS